MLGRDAVVVEHPATLRVGAAHAVFLPGQRHGSAIDRQVDAVNHRALFDLGALCTTRTDDDASDLFDHQLDARPPAFVGQDADIFEANEGRKDLTRVDEDEGASWLLAHTTSLKRLRLMRRDSRTRCSPMKSEEPYCIARRLDGHDLGRIVSRRTRNRIQPVGPGVRSSRLGLSRRFRPRP